jgi:hypothetical protein
MISSLINPATVVLSLLFLSVTSVAGQGQDASPYDLSTDAGITAASEALTGRKLAQRSLNCVRRGKTLPVIAVGTFAFDWGCRFEGVFAKSRYFKTDEGQSWNNALDLLGWQTANAPEREKLALAWVKETWFAFARVLTEKNQDFQDHSFQPPSVITNQDGEVIVTFWTRLPRKGRVRGRSYRLREVKLSRNGAFLSMTTKDNFTAGKDDGG